MMEANLNKTVIDLNKMVREMREKKAQIIDDFCRTYIAARSDFFKADPRRITKLELVEGKALDGSGYVYFFKVKRGRYPKKLKNRKQTTIYD